MYSSHWPGTTIWPQLCKEVSNADKRFLLVDVAMFSWSKTNGLEKQAFSNSSANVYFHLQTSGSMSHLSLWAKGGCFLVTPNIPLSLNKTLGCSGVLWYPTAAVPRDTLKGGHPAASNLLLLPLSPRATLQLQRESITPTKPAAVFLQGKGVH